MSQQQWSRPQVCDMCVMSSSRRDEGSCEPKSRLTTVLWGPDTRARAALQPRALPASNSMSTCYCNVVQREQGSALVNGKQASKHSGCALPCQNMRQHSPSSCSCAFPRPSTNQATWPHCRCCATSVWCGGWMATCGLLGLRRRRARRTTARGVEPTEAPCCSYRPPSAACSPQCSQSCRCAELTMISCDIVGSIIVK
jgi:hypothetical protein